VNGVKAEQYAWMKEKPTLEKSLEDAIDAEQKMNEDLVSLFKQEFGMMKV
jgi:hypothetical protein